MYIHALNPNCLIRVVWSHLIKFNFKVEGIGGSTVPIVLDKSVVDDFEVVTDEESFLMAREVIQKEGLLCGKWIGNSLSIAKIVVFDWLRKHANLKIYANV